MKRKIIAFLNWFLPKDLEPSSAQALRARVFVGSSFFLGAVGLISIAVRLAVTGFMASNNWFLLVCVLSGPFLLRWAVPLGALSSSIVFLIVSVVLWNSGNVAGVETPILLLLLVAPIYTAFLVGLRAAFLMWGFQSLGLLGLWWMQSQELFSFPNAIPATQRHVMRITFTMTFSLFLVGLASIFEWSRRQSERRLRESEERYSLAVQGTHDGIFDWDLVRKHTYISPRFLAMLGYSSEDSKKIKEPKLESLLAPEDQGAFLQQLERCLQMDGGIDLDVRMQNAKGETRWFQLKAGLHFRENAAHRLVGSIRDISQRKSLDELKEEFVSNISHELRTPLTSILGSFGLLQSHVGQNNPRQTEALLDIAHRNTQRLLRLVNDLLDFQKLEQKKTSVKKEPLGVSTFLEECLALHAGFAKQANVALESHIHPGTTASFHADPVRFHQIMANLLSNALKASPPNTVVKVLVSQHENWIRFEVKDQGTGIPEDLKHRLFERFAQGTYNASQHPQFNGTGLGLSIARALVLAHSGNISFTSQPDQGTSFFVDLPLSPPATAMTGRSPSQSNKAVELR